MKMAAPDFAAVLRQAGFKATPGRLELLKILSREGKPLTILEMGKKLPRKLNEATLYRALEALAWKGIVRRVDLQHGHAHYELERKHHHHLVCTDCGLVEDVSSPSLERSVEHLGEHSRRFKSIYSHNLELFGLCNSCSK